jgi:hypothetical protein
MRCVPQFNDPDVSSVVPKSADFLPPVFRSQANQGLQAFAVPLT